MESPEDHGGSSATSAFNILALPEDVVVRIFSFISIKELVTVVSNVCHAWRRLSSDSTLWRSVRLRLFRFDVMFMAQVFRIAPVLQDLSLDSCVFSKLPPFVQDAVCSSSCRVASLRLDIEGDLKPVMIRLLKVQAGSLKSLTLRDCRATHDQAEEFWTVVNSMRSLTSLTIHNKPVYLPSLVESGARLPIQGEPTLKSLRLIGMQRMGDAVESLIDIHARTLVQVDLPTMTGNRETLIAALGRCPNLERLSIFLARSMAPLLSCRALSSLRIVSFELYTLERVDYLDGDAVSFLRSSSGLRSLVLGDVSGDVRPVLRAVRDGCRALVDLSLFMYGVSHGWELIPEVVRDLPALERLQLGQVPPKDVLDSMVLLASLPLRLRVLDVKGSCHRAELLGKHEHECSLPAMRHLLTRHPQLHICGFNTNTDIICKRNHCACEDSHTELGIERFVLHSVAFYGHPPALDCDICKNLKMLCTPRIRLVREVLHAD